MKKMIQKILGSIMVFAMMFSMSIATFATEPVAESQETYDITVKDANPGHTYGAYQLFSGNISGEGQDDVTHLIVDIEWGESVTSNNLEDELLNALKASELSEEFKDCEDAKDVADELRTIDFASDSTGLNQFAEVVGNFFEDNNVEPYQSTNEYDATNKTYTFSDVHAGYYLIKDMQPVESDASTLYILDVAKNITVEPKTGVPTVEKKVLEDSTLGENDKLPADNSDYNDAADWEIGQTKSFTIYANLPTEMWGYDSYYLKFTDSYEDGFTITDKDGTGLDAGVMDTTNYNVYYFYNNQRAELDSSTFEAILTLPVDGGNGSITFECDDIQAALKEKGVHAGEVTVVVEYYAELNENAEVGLGGNINDVELEYSNDPYTDGKGKTEKDKVIVFTFELEGTKVDADNEELNLKGAEFIFGKSSIIEGDGANKPDQWAIFDENTGLFKSWTSNEEEATVLKSGEDGKFHFGGIDSGVYFLRETKAPAGYNKLDSDVKIKISAVYKDEAANGIGDEDIYTQYWDSFDSEKAITGYRVTIDNMEQDRIQTGDSIKLTIENESGSKLPSTGDTGRGIFYAIGAMGFSLVAIILITRKRMSKYKK